MKTVTHTVDTKVINGKPVNVVRNYFVYGKGVKGEFYPCKPDIFDLTYEIFNENN